MTIIDQDVHHFDNCVTIFILSPLNNWTSNWVVINRELPYKGDLTNGYRYTFRYGPGTRWTVLRRSRRCLPAYIGRSCHGRHCTGLSSARCRYRAAPEGQCAVYPQPSGNHTFTAVFTAVACPDHFGYRTDLRVHRSSLSKPYRPVELHRRGCSCIHRSVQYLWNPSRASVYGEMDRVEHYPHL
ncbi:hypothetical protein D3C75_585730 [compost metagenome]